jgi:DNA polymerase iota
MVEHNLSLLNPNDVLNSFFCLDKDDPTVGFAYDASRVFGPTFPAKPKVISSPQDDPLLQRLILGSHLATHLRHELEKEKGYTATVGIATNKILSKLVGNANKPYNQTTLIPSYDDTPSADSHVTQFLDQHDIGKIPGIGFKLAQKIRGHVLGRAANINEGLMYGGTIEKVTVRDVRLFSGMGPELLEEILSGHGSQKGIGGRIWDLLHGIDDTEVSKAKRVPTQISQEDSYMKYLRTFEDVRKQLLLLAKRLLVRMHLDLMEDDVDDDDDETHTAEPTKRRWLAHPRTLRLSTRPRSLPNADRIRARTFSRISRSAPFPNFAFSLSENVTTLAERMVETCLVPMFRQLHPQQSEFHLSLINVACTNMAETAANTKDSDGRDIGRMFRNQDDVLKDFKVTEPFERNELKTLPPLDNGKDSRFSTEPDAEMDVWDEEEDDDSYQHWSSSDNTPGPDSAESTFECPVCQAMIPAFASAAHMRYHDVTDGD